MFIFSFVVCTYSSITLHEFHYEGVFITIGIICLYFLLYWIGEYNIKYVKNITPVNVVDNDKAKILDANNDGKIQLTEIFTMSEDEIISEILKNDCNFSDVQFKLWVKNIFMNYLNVWNLNDLDLIKKYESNSLYMSDSLNIKNNINNGFIHKYERIGYRDSLIKDYKIEGNNQIIIVAITCKVKDYVFDTKSENVVSGSDEHKFRSYLLTFFRNKGVVSDYSITSGKYDWCLIDFRMIDITTDMSYTKM